MDTGIGIANPLFFIGIVENNDDLTLEGRVQVRAFGVHGTRDEVKTKELPWAMCVAGNYDPNHQPPPLNSFVWGVFLDGRDAQQPMILGLIPTTYAEAIVPAEKGWGVIPHREGDLLAKGSAPEDFGQAAMSRLMRGEYIHETYVLSQEMNRCEDMKVGGKDETWSEPSAAYATKYPHNRVIETTHHSIELDDSPGGERIMIRHKEGGFIQIDSKGNMTQKSSADQFDITCGNKHEYSEGRHIVTIGGDAHVYVKGNKTEEIEGDYVLACHGNILLGSGGQLNINGTEQVQIRAADVKMEANVGTLGIKGKKEVQIDSGIDISLTGKRIYNTSLFTFEVSSLQVAKITAPDNHISGGNLWVNMIGSPPVTPLPGFTVGQIGAIPDPALIPGIHIQNLGTVLSLKNAGLTAIDTVGTTTIKSGGLLQLQAGVGLDINAGGDLSLVSANMGLSTTNLNISSLGAAVITGTTSLDLSSTGTAKLNGSLVDIGTSAATASVTLPTLTAITPPQLPSIAIPGLPGEGTKLPDPPTKSTKIKEGIPPTSGNSGGYVSPDPSSE